MIDEVTVVSASVCLLLLISELLAFMRVEVINHMTVDSTPSMGLVPINFDITFPLVDCKGEEQHRRQIYPLGSISRNPRPWTSST